jgi:hypothetical protein
MKKYQKIRTIGHRDVESLFDAPFVIVQEKIDGSNFGFGRKHDGTVFCMSRTQDLDMDKPEKGFAPAVEHVKKIRDIIPRGFLFRCEFLRSAKHNVLAYGRAPHNHLVLFEVEYLDPLTGASTQAVNYDGLNPLKGGQVATYDSLWVAATDLLPQGLDKFTYAGTLTLLFALSNVMKIPAYGALGQLTRENLMFAAVLLPLAVAANYAGLWLVRRTSTEMFFRIAYVLMFFIAIELMRSSLTELWWG